MPAIVSGSRQPSQLRSRSIALRSRWPRGCRRLSRAAASSPGEREVVGLDRLEALEVVLLGRLQHLLDPLGAEAVEPVAGDVVRVLVADDPVVGGDHEAALGVDHLRQLVVGDRPLPLELAAPARLRQVGAAAAPERQAADQLVADRAGAVGPDHVRGGRGVALELGHQLGAGGDVEQLEGGFEGGRFGERLPGERQRLALVGAERLVDDRAVVGGAHLERDRLGAALDDDLLAPRSAAAATRLRTGSCRPRPARRRGPGRRP